VRVRDGLAPAQQPVKKCRREILDDSLVVSIHGSIVKATKLEEHENPTPSRTKMMQFRDTFGMDVRSTLEPLCRRPIVLITFKPWSAREAIVEQLQHTCSMIGVGITNLEGAAVCTVIAKRVNTRIRLALPDVEIVSVEAPSLKNDRVHNGDAQYLLTEAWMHEQAVAWVNFMFLH
jgi:hypothetical protein